MRYQTDSPPLTLNETASELVDPFGRKIDYLRLSVTDRCNLRCTYCMAEDMTFLPRAQVLSIEEMQRLARIFVGLGTRKIRLTGGEPTVRKGILQLCQYISALPGLRELVMTTNAVLLEEMAQPLVESGVKRLNISIDSLKPERFKQLTRFGALAQVKRGIDQARQAGFEKIKLNAVILRGVNDDEVLALADYALSRDMDISFIEEMPLGHIDSHLRTDTQISSSTVADILGSQYQLKPIDLSTGGPSRYQQVMDKGGQVLSGKVGFISPMSDNFCASCNRVRLTVEGRLLLCLGNEHSMDLRALLRDKSLNDADIAEAIKKAIGNKPERHYFDPNDTQIVRFMSATGG